MTQSIGTELKDLILGMDKKLDVFIARTNERFNSIEQRFDSIDKRLDNLESQVKSTDNRLWTFVGILVTALLGALAKVFLFPQT